MCASNSSEVPSSPSQRWFTVDEAALYLRVSPGTIRQLIHTRDVRAVSHLGQGYRLDRNDLDLLLEKRKKFHAPYRKNTHPWVAARHAAKRQDKKRASR